MSKTIDTDYGKFKENYFQPVHDEEGEAIGANMYMEFEPGEKVVAAKKIGIVQMGRMTRNKKANAGSKERKALMVKKGPAAGWFIDQDPNLPNPVYATGTELEKKRSADDIGGYKDDEIRKADPDPQKRDSNYGLLKDRKYAGYGTYGYKYWEAKHNPLEKNATFQDTPHISPSSKNESELFETTALVLESPPGLDFQKGLYLGSVKWGWTRTKGKFETHSIELVSKGAPSENFFSAAEQWNTATTATGKATVDLPMSSGIIKADKARFFGDEKDIGSDKYDLLSLNHNCRIVRTKYFGADMYFNIRVTDSSNMIKEGWVKSDQVEPHVFQK
jgi:hypothetical protein